MRWRAMKSFENTFEPSSCAVSLEGAKHGMFTTNKSVSMSRLVYIKLPVWKEQKGKIRTRTEIALNSTHYGNIWTRNNQIDLEFFSNLN